MNVQQAENLRILIRHMETDCQRTLDMCSVTTPCGTPACALGEAKFNVPELAHHFNGRCSYDVAEELFGFSREGSDHMAPDHVYRLFGGRLNDERFVSGATWAAEARKVLAENGYAMTPADDGFAAFRARLLEPVALTA